MPLKPRFTKAELDNLTNSFTDEEIATQVGLTRLAILYYRKKWNIPSCREKNGWTRRREDFGTYFDSIDTPAKAYFLGLIATDGSIDGQHSVDLALHPQDVEILEIFRNELDTSLPIGFKKSKSVKGGVLRTVRIYRKHMTETLTEWGITPNKSTTLRMLKLPPSCFLRDFVRGAWDGDGTISLNRTFKLTSGSSIFIEQIQDLILANTGIKLSISKEQRFERTGNPIYYLHGSSGSYSALSWIYKDGKPVMARKAIRFSRFFK